MSERSYARRRRAAVPAALAAFLFLVIVAGSDAPARRAGEHVVPAMTIVLPPSVVAASEPAAEDPPGEPPGDPLPLDAGEPAPAPLPLDGGAAAEQEPAAQQPAAEDEPPPPADEQPERPAVRRVFLVVLAQTDLVALADDSAAAPYVAGKLVPSGTLLTAYASAARGSLANGVALVSGQGPTQATLADCPTAEGAAPADVAPDEVGADAQQLGDGCVYPFTTGTVADQLVGAGLDWRAYVEDAAAPCPVTPRNPFAWFHSLTDDGACARRVGGLQRLDADLARTGASAPALLYVVPGPCHDGRPEPCAPGAPAGAAAADAFLADVVPRILASPAFADGGLIVVTSDGPPVPAAPAPPAPAAYPNVGDAAAAGAARVGALLIGDAVRAGVRSDAPAGHFALLRTISDLFALQPLGYAGLPAPLVPAAH